MARLYCPFEKYFSAFSLLNETRKKQFVEILSKRDNLPLYYPEDAEVYIRAGRLASGEILAAVFNLSQDAIDELPLVLKDKVNRVEMLDECGERVACDCELIDGVVYIKKSLAAMEPRVFFIS